MNGGHVDAEGSHLAHGPVDGCRYVVKFEVQKDVASRGLRFDTADDVRPALYEQLQADLEGSGHRRQGFYEAQGLLHSGNIQGKNKVVFGLLHRSRSVNSYA